MVARATAMMLLLVAAAEEKEENLLSLTDPRRHAALAHGRDTELFDYQKKNACCH